MSLYSRLYVQAYSYTSLTKTSLSQQVACVLQAARIQGRTEFSRQ